jgi:hypothetical protein
MCVTTADARRWELCPVRRESVLHQDEANFDSVTYTYYEQLNGHEYLKQFDIGYFF